MLKNKLGIINEVEASKEEWITKLKALELFDSNKINEIPQNTYDEIIEKFCTDNNNSKNQLLLKSALYCISHKIPLD